MTSDLGAPVDPALVRIRGLRKAYRRNGAVALDGVDLDIPQGSAFGLLGPNGAGKTTLVAILCGILRADGGSVEVRDAAGHWHAVGAGSRAVAPLIGLVPQALAFYPTLSVRENLIHFGRLQGVAGARLAARVEASLAIGRLEHHARQRAETLSGGLQRRLNLAIGVIHAPPLLVLDEPTVGVDAQSRRFLLDELARLNAAGTTLLYTSHYMDEVEQLCDRLAVIDHGRLVVQGSRDELLRDDIVVLRTAAPPPASMLDELAAQPATGRLRHDGTLLTLASAQPGICLEHSLHLARQHGVEVIEASYGRRSLDTLFFQLTGAQLRDQPGDERTA